MDEQSQQENLEEKLKDSVDCLTDKRYCCQPLHIAPSLVSLWEMKPRGQSIAYTNPSSASQCQDSARSSGEPAPGPGLPPAS